MLYQGIYTYGEYLRIYVDEIRARGANPLLLSLTSRKGRGEDGKIHPSTDKTEVIKAVAEEKGVPFIDFNSAICDKYNNVFDSAKVEYLYYSDHIRKRPSAISRPPLRSLCPSWIMT